MKFNTKEAKDKEDTILSQQRRSKAPLPKFLIEKQKTKTELAYGLDFYYKSFWKLCTDRPFAEIILHIPWSKIQGYADYYEMDFDDAEQFHYLINKMDDAYVEYMRENGKPKQDKPSDTRKPVDKRAKHNNGEK